MKNTGNHEPEVNTVNPVDTKIMTDEDWGNLSEKDLDVMERKIASKYMNVFPWGVVAWGLGNSVVWLTLWPLVLMNAIPLWLAAPIATLNVMLAYLPSHEAQHNIIARKGHPLRWLNELVGHVSLIPFGQPFRLLRHTHMEHHAHCNHPQLDPDFGVSTIASNKWDFFKNSLLQRQPGSNSNDSYAEALKRTGKSHIMIDALAYNLIYTAVLFSLAWSGHAIEVALLWWLPRHITITYINYYLSWMPHRPAEKQGRYKDTKAFRSRLGNIGSMGMQYHTVHHLYPTIPLSLTPTAFRELRPILQRKGCDFRGL
jgi:beta-carotene hydroxylase